MNKKELIDDVCFKTKLTKKEIDMVLTSILEIIVTKVSQGDRVRLVGFGSFYTYKKRFAIDSKYVTKRSIVKFSPGKFFKQKINVQN
jgi:DNA-binding protein HU-beta